MLSLIVTLIVVLALRLLVALVIIFLVVIVLLIKLRRTEVALSVRIPCLLLLITALLDTRRTPPRAAQSGRAGRISVRHDLIDCHGSARKGALFDLCVQLLQAGLQPRHEQIKGLNWEERTTDVLREARETLVTAALVCE